MNIDLESQVNSNRSSFFEDCDQILRYGSVAVAFMVAACVISMEIFRLSGDEIQGARRDLFLGAFVLCFASVCGGIISAVSLSWERTFIAE